MRLYRTTAGAWAGTQADAGKGFEQVEVPTDKLGLIAWLNANRAPVAIAPLDWSDPRLTAAAPAIPPPTTKLNLAPLHYGASWREVRGGIAEAAQSLGLAAALDWIEHATARVRELLAGDPPVEGVEPEA